MAIKFCQGTYAERIPQTKACLERIAPHVDECVIIADETITFEQARELGEIHPSVGVASHPWEDSMPKMRNQYLEKCSLGDWVIVSDPDEIFCEEFCRNIREICRKAEENGIGLLLINSHDIWQRVDGNRSESVSNFFKNLIFRYWEGVRYEGVGAEKTVHETLILPPDTKTVALPRKYYYEHLKTEVEVWERAFRNVWIAGGGNNVGEKNPRWSRLRFITHFLELKTWPQVREYLRTGNIDSELRKWVVDCRLEKGWDWQNEMQDCFRFYKVLHPGEMEGLEIPENLKPFPGSPPEVTAFVEKTYLEVMGRHADDRGKTAYANAILEGKLRREDLAGHLKRSTEYQEKFAPQLSEPGRETMKVTVPVNVSVDLTYDMVIKALMQSNIWWEQLKPRLDFVQAVESLVEDPKELYGEFYSMRESGMLTFENVTNLILNRLKKS